MTSKKISKGVLYMILATLFFTIMQIIIKYLQAYHVSQIIFFRSSMTSLFCFWYLTKNKIPFKGKKNHLLILRALFGIISMTLFFITIQRIPYGSSVTLKYLSPIFAIVLAMFFLKEKIYPIQWLFFALALLGIFVLKGFDARLDNLSLILAVLGAFFGGCVYVTIRKIGISENPIVIVNYFMFSAAILSGIVMLKFWTQPSTIEFLLLIIMGSIGFLGQKYMTLSFQLEETNKVAPLKYMELVYAFLIGFVFFGETYSIFATAGLLLIVASFLLNLRFKVIKSKIN